MGWWVRFDESLQRRIRPYARLRRWHEDGSEGVALYEEKFRRIHFERLIPAYLASVVVVLLLDRGVAWLKDGYHGFIQALKDDPNTLPGTIVDLSDSWLLTATYWFTPLMVSISILFAVAFAVILIETRVSARLARLIELLLFAGSIYWFDPQRFAISSVGTLLPDESQEFFASHLDSRYTFASLWVGLFSLLLLGLPLYFRTKWARGVRKHGDGFRRTAYARKLAGPPGSAVPPLKTQLVLFKQIVTWPFRRLFAPRRGGDEPQQVEGERKPLTAQDRARRKKRQKSSRAARRKNRRRKRGKGK